MAHVSQKTQLDNILSLIHYTKTYKKIADMPFDSLKCKNLFVIPRFGTDNKYHGFVNVIVVLWDAALNFCHGV